MKESGGSPKKWNLFQKKEKSAPKPADEYLTEEAKPRNKVLEVFRIIGVVFFRLRKVFLAIPVVFAALRLAAYNTDNLPLLVGLDLQTTGEFAHTISRQTAVTAPLMITGACLVLMFFSRKSTYPWLISVFSLLLPILLLITNMYPA